MERATPKRSRRREKPVRIDRRDIMRAMDAWDVQEVITQTYVKQPLQHPAFRFEVAFLLLVNAITIGLRTNSYLSQKYYNVYNIIDQMVLLILTTELILQWLNGFWIYWKDGWNILKFFIIFILLLGLFIEELNCNCFTNTLRLLRLLPVCMEVKPLSWIILVILQSVPEMARIIALILFVMLVFAVIGVTLFGPVLPQHFGNLWSALHTLFICLTQDGWVEIYYSLQTTPRDYVIEISGAFYFATFIIIGSFIGMNLLVAVVITNLELMMKEREREQQQQVTFTEGGNMEEEENEELVHGDTLRSEESNNPQTPLEQSTLRNLIQDQCNNLCLVLEAIEINFNQYKEIRTKLDSIVEEVRSISFNKEQEEEMLRRPLPVTQDSESSLYDMTQQDLMTSLLNLEKLRESVPNLRLRRKSSLARHPDPGGDAAEPGGVQSGARGAQAPSVYHERQRLELCAVHALNNVLQQQLFSQEAADAICERLAPGARPNPHRSPLGTGNYDANVVLAALQGRGLAAVWWDRRRPLSRLALPQVLGLILNLNLPAPAAPGLVALPQSRHWVALRQVGGVYYNLDSRLPAPEALGDEAGVRAFLEAALAQGPSEVLLVVTKDVEQRGAWLQADEATPAPQ